MKSNQKIEKDALFVFGNSSDGVIGIPALTEDGHVVEASCFYGDAKPKHIVVISSQVGCPMRCSFCELGGVRRRRNLTAAEMAGQVSLVMTEASRQGLNFSAAPYKVTVANSGEPLLNPNLIGALERIAGPRVSFKISTVFPSSSKALRNLEKLACFARVYSQPVQLQISLISTVDSVRRKVVGANVGTMRQIRDAGDKWRRLNPGGRKINLSLIVTDAMPCDPQDTLKLLPPELFRFRFREYVPTFQGQSHGHGEVTPERLRRLKDDFAANGYEVSDWASPTATERRFGLASNAIRRMYLEVTRN